MFVLIPIDHGLSLPDEIDICDYEMTWMSWPQAKKPFTKTELNFIENIDIEKDIELLKSLGTIREVNSLFFLSHFPFVFSHKCLFIFSMYLFEYYSFRNAWLIFAWLSCF
jgi:Phosphatidylinositol 3- and 4-kinase